MALLAPEYIQLKPLIAIIGDDASKQTLTAYLKHQFVPQLNVISLLDASEFASCLAPPTGNSNTEQQHHRTGILRADWLEKHQSRRPAVALVLVPRHHAIRDPSSWATLASSLDAIRAIAKSAKIRVVVAVIQPPGETPSLPDDRIAMLARHSGAERGCVITYESGAAAGGGGALGSSQSSPPSNRGSEAAMRSLAVLLQAQAAVYYSTNAQIRLNSYSQNGLASVDANLRAAFKLGALAEMRGDWPGAVQLYKEAYGYVGQVSMAGGAPLQRFLEVRTVAEVVHHRLLALLLGALRDPSAAATQLTTHLDMLRTVPLQPSTAPPSVIANHYGWLAQQYTTAAELVLSSALAPSSFPPNMRPAQLFLEAYHAAATRRRLVQELYEARGGSFVTLSNKEESVSSGRYLGQIEIPKGFSNPSDEQIETWLEIEELEKQENILANSSSNSSKLSCVYLLEAAKNAAIESLTTTSSSSSSKKLLARIDTLLGEELLYFSKQDSNADTIASAKNVLCTAAEQYRTDRWSGPLYRVLMALRECASRQGNTAEHVVLSLEAAAVSLENKSNSTSDDTTVEVLAMAQAAIEELTTKIEKKFVVDTETLAPWSSILKISELGFRSSNYSDTNRSVSFIVKLVNVTPVDIPFLSATMVFEDSNDFFEVEAVVEKIFIKAMHTLELVFRIPFSNRKHSPWLEASKFVVNLSENVSITYVLPDAARGRLKLSPPTPPAGGQGQGQVQNLLRIELPPRYNAPEVALLVPGKAFIGEYLPAKVRIAVLSTASASSKRPVLSKKCRIIVSAAVAGKAAAVLFTTQTSIQPNSNVQQLKEQLEFDIKDINFRDADNTGPDGAGEIDFGFAVQAPIEETIVFSAQLHYTIENTDNLNEEKEEEEQQGMVEVHAAVPVLFAFECDVVTTPMMALPPVRLTECDNSTIQSNSTINSTIRAGPVFTMSHSSPAMSHLVLDNKKDSSSPLVQFEVEDALAASLQSLSVHDAQVRRSVIPRLPSHFTMPVVTTCAAAVVHLRKVKPTGGEWRNDVALESLSITGLCIDTIESNGTSSSALKLTPLVNENEEESLTSIGQSNNKNNNINNNILAEISTPGDTCSAAFQITILEQGQDQEQAIQGVKDNGIVPSLGNLSITWRRSSWKIPLVAHSSSSKESLNKAEKEEMEHCIGYLEGFQDGNLVIPLPPVVFTFPMITAQPFFPSCATVGQPITLEIEIGFPIGHGKMLENMHYLYHEVEVVVGEPHGFLIAGPRATTVARTGGGGNGDGGERGLNSDCSRVSFVLVPYHVGYLELPEVKVYVDGERELQATQGCIVDQVRIWVLLGAGVVSMKRQTGQQLLPLAALLFKNQSSPMITSTLSVGAQCVLPQNPQNIRKYSSARRAPPPDLSQLLSDKGLLQSGAHIGGDWLHSNSTFEVHNPATGQPIASVSDCGAAETDAAISAAAAAFPAWAARPAKDRAAIMRKWHELILASRDDITKIMTIECGKPLAESRNEFDGGAESVAWFADEARRVDGDVLQTPARDKRFLVLRQPIGVVGAVTPWNFPFSMITRKTAPAIAAGCTVVLKPSELTPLTALALAELGKRAGLPDGVFNIVPTNKAKAVGDALVASPLVRKIGFTGSTAVGKALYAGAASTVKRVSLELGGNAPFIVFEDADLDKAARDVVLSSYRNAGQTCICTNRVLVADSIHDSFAEKLVKRVQALRVGDGMENGVTHGPMITGKAVDTVEAKVAEATAAGARVATGGTRPEFQSNRDGDSSDSLLSGGYFYEPTVLTHVDPSMRIFKEEIFGPVTPLVSFSSEEEALKLANGTPYGLASYFYTRDLGRAWRVAEGLQFGMVGVNEVAITAENVPFGGVKESGLGRENSKYGIQEYLDMKTVCMGIS